MNVIFAALKVIEPNNLPRITDPNQETLKTILGVVWVIIGSVGVLLLVIAGTRFIFAQGDSNKMTQSKNMIIYTVMGLVIAASASVVVNVIIDRVGR